MSYGALFSRLIGMILPGPGALWTSQSFRFKQPVFIGDRLTLRIVVTHVSQSTRSVTLDCTAINQGGSTVLTGTGEVMVLEREVVEEVPNQPKQRAALIAGASRGIGAAIAKRLASEGFMVAVTYRASRDEAEALVSGMDNAIALQSDITDPKAAQIVVAQVLARFGTTPDILVLCASNPTLYGAAADGDFRLFANHLDSQLLGPHALVSACLVGMLERGHGVFVAIGSSVTESAPPVGMTPYVVAKSALTSYMKCLAVEFGPKGIRANVVAPGLTHTALLAAVPNRLRKVAAAQTPTRRLGKPTDIAGAVSYLVSDSASHVNGHTLLVSGGNPI